MNTKNLSFIAVLLIFFLASATVFAQDGELVNEDAPRMTARQRTQIKNLNAEFKAKFEAAAKRDKRYAQYKADVDELRKIDDAKKFEEKYAAFKNKHAAFQAEILKKAGITERQFNLRLKRIMPRIQLDNKGRIINPKQVTKTSSADLPDGGWYQAASYWLRDETFEITNFSETWSFKDCDQADITFDSSKEFDIYTTTNVDEPDCDDVKAARGAVINVPAGVKRVRVEITLDKYRVMTYAAAYAFFGYGNAYSAVGIRVRGFIVGSARQTNYWRHKYLESSWSVLGDSTSASTETNARFSCSFIPLVAGQYTIQAYGRITVDTDGFAFAQAHSTVEGLKKIKITFVK